jgi:hypothetical protein
MNKQKQLGSRYAWRHAWEILDAFFKQIDLTPMDVAWMKAQLIISAQAQFHEQLGNSEEDAVAMAWEDFDIACRGRGEPCVTGAIFQLWSRLPKKHDRKFIKALTTAFQAARDNTDPMAQRYAPLDYAATLQSVEDGFDSPEAIPLIHIPRIESIKSARDLKNAINKVVDFSNSPFAVIEGGKDETPEAPDEVF